MARDFEQNSLSLTSIMIPSVVHLQPVHVVHTPAPVVPQPQVAPEDNDERKTGYVLLRILLSSFSYWVCIKLGRRQYDVRVSQSLQDVHYFQHQFDDVVHNFTLHYPECAPIIMSKIIACGHSCLDLLKTKWQPAVLPTGQSDFLAFSRDYSSFGHGVLGYILYSGIADAAVYMEMSDERSSSFKEFKSWKGFYRASYLVPIGLSIVFQALINWCSFGFGDRSGTYDSRAQAFSCVPAKIFGSCDTISECSSSTSEASSLYNVMGHILLQCALLGCSALLPKIVHWLWDDASAFIDHTKTTVKNLVGGVCRFFCHPFSSRVEEPLDHHFKCE